MVISKKNIYNIYREPQCKYPRRNWDSLSQVCPSPRNQRVGGGEDLPAGEGVGESQFRQLEKSLALCLLCGNISVTLFQALSPPTLWSPKVQSSALQ
jgi:hypothetical protein